MIVNFRHRGLERLYKRGDRRRINPNLVAKVERVLALIDDADHPTQLDLPGYRLHRLRGGFVDTWAIAVSANWRITFRFVGSNAHDVDLVDYH